MANAKTTILMNTKGANKKVLDMLGVSGDKKLYDLIVKSDAAEEYWDTTENLPGGDYSWFARIIGADGVERLLGVGCIDLYGLTIERQPWFDESAASRRETHFAVIVENTEEIERIASQLDSIDYDPYRAQDHAREMQEAFESVLGVVRETYEEW